MWDLRADSTEMETMKWCISDGNQIALTPNMKAKEKISKDRGTGSTWQERCRWALSSCMNGWNTLRDGHGLTSVFSFPLH